MVSIVAVITWEWTSRETLVQRVITTIVVANSVFGVEDIASRQGFQKAPPLRKTQNNQSNRLAKKNGRSTLK